ncbi:MAG: hypothetical protein ACREDR_10000 [Blastocatellia bacterium]
MTKPIKTYDAQIADRCRAASLLIQASTIEILLALRCPRLRDQSDSASRLAAKARSEAYEINSTLSTNTRLHSDDLKNLHLTALSIASARHHNHHREAEAIQRDALYKLTWAQQARVLPTLVQRNSETLVTAHDHFRFHPSAAS